MTKQQFFIIENNLQKVGVIKFVSDLRQVSGFHQGGPVSSTNKTDCHDITEIVLKVAGLDNNVCPIVLYQ
jgi:hypothetical protein